MDNKKIELEITKLVLSTYNKVALWNNNDYDSTKQKSDALKIVCQDIVQCALEELMVGLNLTTGTVVSRGDTIIGDHRTEADTQSFEDVDEKDILGKLFDK